MRTWVGIVLSCLLAAPAWGQANPVPPDDEPMASEPAADATRSGGARPPELAPSRAVKKAPGDAKVVAVLVSARVNLEKDDADRIAGLLGQALESKLEVYVPSDSSARLPDEGLPTKCVVTPDCIRDLGKQLGADHLILLTAVRIGQNIQIDPIWVEVASGRALPRKSLTVQVDKDPRETFLEQARWLLPDTRVRERPKQAQTIFVKSPERHMTTPSWIALGVTVAAVAGATTFSLLARSQDAKLRGELDFQRPVLDDAGEPTGEVETVENADCRRVDCPDSELDKLDNYALAADVLWGTAIAAAATGIVFYVLSKPDAEETPLLQNVSAGPTATGGAQVGLTLRF